MSNTVIKIENLSKEYRLGVIGHGTLYRDVQSWWAKVRGRPDPNSRLDAVNPNQNKDTILAIENINLEVKNGQILGIIGANGAGKSTLLKILSKVTAPTSGTIKYKGRVASLLEVGTGFHQELTGRENIYLNGAINGMNKIEVKSKLDEIVDFAGIGKFLDTPVKRYSSGMYVRLGFAIAAHLEPDILLVDEVLAVGDTSFQKKAVGKMQDVSKREGRTVLFVSHNMATISTLCGRAILLNKGKIEQDGKSNDIVSKYLSNVESTAKVVWPDINKAPGNDVVRLLSVCILQDGIEDPSFMVDREKETQIEITYINLKNDNLLYTGIRLKYSTGTRVLSHSNHKCNNLLEDKWFDQPQPKGTFKSICRIPAKLLVEGQYMVDSIIGIQPIDTQISEEDVVTFRVYDKSQGNRKSIGGWDGVVCPPMAWNTEKIELNN